MNDETQTPQNFDLKQPEVLPTNPVGIPESVSITPEEETLRNAVHKFTSDTLLEENLVTKATDEEGKIHEFRGEDIIIEPVEKEPKVKILNKYTGTVIGIFLLGGLLTAISRSHYRHKDQ